MYQNATQETLVMTDVDSSGDEDHSIEHGFMDMGNNGGAQLDQPTGRRHGNVPPHSLKEVKMVH